MKQKKPRNNSIPLPAELEILDVNGHGNGVARLDQLVYVVPKAFPGDRVKPIKALNRKRYLEVTQFKLMERTVLESDQGCKHFQDCGACQTMGISDAAYYDWKSKVIKNTFRGLLKDFEPVQIVFDRNLGFRNRTVFDLSNDRKSLARRNLDKNKIPVSSCPILSEAIQELIPGVNSLLKSLPKNTLSPDSRITLHLYKDCVFMGFACPDSLKERSLKRIQELAHEKLTGCGVFQCFIQAGQPSEKGFRWILKPIESLKNWRPGIFEQTNPGIETKLSKTIRSELETISCTSLIDLYSGMGKNLFDNPELQLGIGVEANPRATQFALETAKKTGLSQFHFFCASIPDFPDPFYELIQAISTILVNPPRAGLGKAFFENPTLSSQLEKKIQNFIYISCNPITWERDARELTKIGFRLKKCTAFDMFPMTRHFELVTVFSKG